MHPPVIARSAPTAFARLKSALDRLDHAVPCASDEPDAEMWWSDDPSAQGVAAVLCLDCPLYWPCRDYGDAAREPSGVWGGVTEWERIGKRTRGRPPGRGTRVPFPRVA